MNDITYIDDYFIINEIGKVYKVKSDDNTYALKILNENDDDVLKRFEREIKIHKSLNHENIISVIDFKLDKSEKNYYVMDLADGNLNDIINEYRQENFGECMDDDTVYYYFNQILNGIEYAHKEGVIHRDLKPLNILKFGENLKISDFGLGKFLKIDMTQLTQTKFGMGSDIYASPEQLVEGNAKNADERSDIYALGQILYELITFSAPVVINEEKLKKSKFRYIVKKAIKYNPDDRFKSIEEMKNKFEVLFNSKKNKGCIEEFINKYSLWEDSKDTNILSDILELLIDNKEDYNLYVDYFMKLNSNDIGNMYKKDRDNLTNVIEIYLEHIDCDHSFSFVDKISNFIIDILKIIDNIDIIEKSILVLLRLGYRHNRFYVGDSLIKYMCNIDDAEILMIFEECLEKDRNCEKWIRTYIDKYKLPIH